jgi:hypothetical protein
MIHKDYKTTERKSNQNQSKTIPKIKLKIK